MAVRGNNDTPAKWAEEESDRLEQLPLEAKLGLPGGPLVVVHGDRVLPAHERHERLRPHYAQARAVAYGQTHRLRCDQREKAISCLLHTSVSVAREGPKGCI